MSDININQHNLSIQNKKNIEEQMLYATENHLVWIESVMDILNRRADKKARLDYIDREMKNCEDQSAEYDYGNERNELLTSMTKITDGLKREVKTLSHGTIDFYKTKLFDQFITWQQDFVFQSNTNYEKFGRESNNFLDKSTIEDLDKPFSRSRVKSINTDGADDVSSSNGMAKEVEYQPSDDSDEEQLD